LAAPALQPVGAALLARGPDAVACGRSAGWALGLDGVDKGVIEIAILSGSHKRNGTRRRLLVPNQVIPLGPFRMTDPITTLLDLAALLDDRHWEWSLESALRKPFVTTAEVMCETDRRSGARVPGAARARRVLACRPAAARPTGSQLETEFIQLMRPVAEIPEPERQYPVVRGGVIAARLDVAYTDLRAYTEVHGGQHRESLQYDTYRETMVAGTLGWLASEVTARDIRRNARSTIGRMIEFIRAAARNCGTVGPLGT
jgi:hypothetical protein